MLFLDIGDTTPGLVYQALGQQCREDKLEVWD